MSDVSKRSNEVNVGNDVVSRRSTKFEFVKNRSLNSRRTVEIFTKLCSPYLADAQATLKECDG